MEATATPDSDDLPIEVVVGLGNPGSRYAATRHNVGFMVVDRLLSEAGGRWCSSAASSTANIVVRNADVILVKPLTYMNCSGKALAELQKVHTFKPEQVLVVFDDFYLPFSKVRLRRGGSDGGHNGLASVLGAMRTESVPRLRLGIGRIEGDDDIDFVLSEFTPHEPVDGLVDRGCRAVESCVGDGLDTAMNCFNGCQLL